MILTMRIKNYHEGMGKGHLITPPNIIKLLWPHTPINKFISVY